MKKSFWKKNVGFILFYILLMVIIIVYFAFFHATKKYEIVDSLTNLPEPIQTPTTGGFSRKIVTGEKEIDKYLSNIHAIHSNYKIEKLLQMVKVNDYIRIKGYLVNVDSETGGYWHSNVIKNADGELIPHECEIVYVENLVWLKEK